MIKAIVGINWGDEGKGKMTDYFATDVDCVIRYQGGDNAGHTVINEKGKFAFHNIPSGISYDNVLCIIGPGSVINPESFSKEIEELKKQGLKTENIIISDRANIIFPFHRLLDELEDQRLKDKKYGSTKSGIAPVYGDKYMKKGIQAGELFHPDYLKEHLADLLDFSNMKLKGIYKEKAIELEDVLSWLKKYQDNVKPYIKNIQAIISDLINNDKKILMEAQLGALRDITHGIYPYTTSSSVLAGYSCASIPIPPRKIEEIIGISKAYSTCVGAGEFVTEMNDNEEDLANYIREKGGEYGATTGRPRRIGYFDAVASKYGVRLQSADTMVLTCLDVLSGIEELKICTHYQIDNKKTDIFPLYPELIKAKPIYETLPGWQEDIQGITKYNDLPLNAKKYVSRIEELCDIAIKYISTGPKRSSVIEV
ncbi:adenylosuccinate synthase [Natronospora cellulosivora (SeqCode)]